MADIEKLARIKKLLEDLRSKVEEEEENLKENKEKLGEMLRLLNHILGEQSFFVASDLLQKDVTKKSPEDLKPILEIASAKKESGERENFILRSEDTGVDLADIRFEKNNILISPIPEKVFKQNNSEFVDFFLGKVINEVQKENPNLKIKVKEDRGFIQSISIQNCESERQINRILGALRWVFIKILEKD